MPWVIVREAHCIKTQQDLVLTAGWFCALKRLIKWGNSCASCLLVFLAHSWSYRGNSYVLILQLHLVVVSRTTLAINTTNLDLFCMCLKWFFFGFVFGWFFLLLLFFLLLYFSRTTLVIKNCWMTTCKVMFSSLLQQCFISKWEHFGSTVKEKSKYFPPILKLVL